jgi:hypothetical protein
MAALGIGCVVLFACAGTIVAKMHPAAARLNREFKLKVWQRVTLQGSNLRIKFVKVETDSRCPADVKCVWAGNAAIQVEIASGRQSKAVTLSTGRGPAFVSEVRYQGYKVKLVDLSPYPRSGGKTAPGDYAATLLISKE